MEMIDGTALVVVSPSVVMTSDDTNTDFLWNSSKIVSISHFLKMLFSFDDCTNISSQGSYPGGRIPPPQSRSKAIHSDQILGAAAEQKYFY